MSEDNTTHNDGKKTRATRQQKPESTLTPTFASTWNNSTDNLWDENLQTAGGDLLERYGKQETGFLQRAAITSADPTAELSPDLDGMETGEPAFADHAFSQIPMHGQGRAVIQPKLEGVIQRNGPDANQKYKLRGVTPGTMPLTGEVMNMPVADFSQNMRDNLQRPYGVDESDWSSWSGWGVIDEMCAQTRWSSAANLNAAETRTIPYSTTWVNGTYFIRIRAEVTDIEWAGNDGGSMSSGQQAAGGTSMGMGRTDTTGAEATGGGEGRGASGELSVSSETSNSENVGANRSGQQTAGGNHPNSIRFTAKVQFTVEYSWNSNPSGNFAWGLGVAWVGAAIADATSDDDEGSGTMRFPSSGRSFDFRVPYNPAVVEPE